MRENRLPVLKENEIFKKEPLAGWSVGYVREWMANHKENADLALITAGAANQLLWISILSENNDKRYQDHIHEEWWWLNIEMIYRVIKTIKTNADHQKLLRGLSVEKKIKLIEPFMNENDFYLKEGWWIYDSKDNEL